MRHFHLLAAAICAVFSVANANAETVTDPDWQVRPTPADMERFYPASAQLLSIEGRASISCQVTTVGLLEGCEVTKETPAGFGFGSAALALGGIFRMSPMQRDGRPVAGGTVCIPISFKLPEMPIASGPQTESVSPRAMALAREVVTLSNGSLKEIVDAGIVRMQATGKAQASGPPTPDQEKAVRDAAAALADDWNTSRAALLASQLNEQELASLVDFAKSPQGAAVLKKSLVLRWRLMFTQMAALGRFQNRARDAFCSNTSCAAYPDAADLAVLQKTKVDIVSPKWATSPTRDQIQRVTPRLALAIQLPGWALLNCTISAIGSPADCVVISDRPKGVGFGEAAKSLAAFYILNADGMKDGGAGKRAAVFIPFTTLSIPSPPPQLTQFDAEKLAVASKLMATQKVKTELSPALLRMAGGSGATFTPGMDPGVRHELMAAVGAGAEAATAEASDLVRAFYAENYTLEELQAMVRLQETPGGRAMEVAGPKLAEGEALLGRVFQAKVSDVARKTYCQSHGCATPADANTPKPALGAS